MRAPPFPESAGAHIEAARPSWDEWGLRFATVAGQRGECRRAQIGAAIFTEDHHLISTGHNGVHSGAPSCLTGACPRGHMSTAIVPPYAPYDSPEGFCIATHAEINALMYADPARTPGGTIYITRAPCNQCYGAISTSPLRYIVYRGMSFEPSLVKIDTRTDRTRT